MRNEEWRPVVGWEGRYEVSNQGRVRSLRWGGAYPLKTPPGKGNYPGFTPSGKDNPDRTRLFVHRAVLEAFVGLKPDGMVCRHLDGNPQNNRLENLRWGTPKENSADAIRHGTHRPGGGHLGEDHHAAKFTEHQVLYVRDQYRRGEYIHSLARRFGVCRGTVRAIVNRRTWTHI